MSYPDHVGVPSILIGPTSRRRLIAVVMGLVVAAAWLASAKPALAYNPCNEPDPPPRCEPYDPVPPPMPAAPTNLTISGALTSTATLTWTDNATTEAGYEVYRWSGTLSSIPSTVGSPIATLPAHAGTGQMSYVDAGVNPNGGYTYAVVAFSVQYRPSPGTIGARQAWSSPVSFPGVPAGPTQFAAAPASGYNVPTTLTWVDHATNAAGYHVYGFWCYGFEWGPVKLLGSTGPSATSFSIPPEPGAEWCYWVTAYNGSGESPAPAGVNYDRNSNPFAPTEFPPGALAFGWPSAPPVAPNVANLTGTVTTQGAKTVIAWAWQAVGNGTYTVAVTDKTTGAGLGSVTQSANSYTYTGTVVPGHTYEIRIVTHISGDTDSSGATSDVTVQTGSGASGVKTLDVYNCSGEDLEIWLWNGAAWVDEGDATATADGESCGSGVSEPLAISMPTGTFNLYGTLDGDQPSGDNTAWGPYLVTGNSTSGATVPLTIT